MFGMCIVGVEYQSGRWYDEKGGRPGRSSSNKCSYALRPDAIHPKLQHTETPLQGQGLPVSASRTSSRSTPLHPFGFLALVHAQIDAVRKRGPLGRCTV
jgi:hypothetical protein